MKKVIICAMIWASLLCGSASGGEIREIVLTDGSVITAEILSFTNGVYTLQSDIMGKILVDDAKIKEIRKKSAGSAAGKQGAVSPSIQGLNLNGLDFEGIQESITENPKIMDIVNSLEKDPDVQKIMEDPELMQAVRSGDVGTLLTRPEVQRLLNNPKVQKIGEELAK
ncbi:MAG: hypothetical protein AB7S75_00545 [Desulfococcaceae bacterium]